MASSTTNKKQIVDFLWDWAESSGDWAKLLVKKVVNRENKLDQHEREEIFNYFLESIQLKKGLPKLTFSKPSYTPSNKHIELDSLSEVTGVNKLAKNQTIDFSPNITVIYGENGTGKTGYSRILKALGFSYDSDKTIYSNVLDQSQKTKSASINYKVNGTPDTFTWDDRNIDEYLKNISVFNSNCVQISLDGSRQLIVSPVGFHLFNIVSSELVELNGLLQAKKSEHPTQLSWTENLHEGTPQHQFINGLSKDSIGKRLNELSDFSQEHVEKLNKKEIELSKLNKSLLQNEIHSLRSKSDELSKVENKIKAAQNTLNAESWKELIEHNKRIAELEKSAQKGIKEIAEDKGIGYFETEEFKNFLSSAEAYIKILSKPEYPEDSDICVYCMQPLEKPAKDLLSSYRTLLNDKSKEDITKLKKEKQELISKVKNEVEARLQLNYDSFGLDEKDKPVQPQKLQDYNQQLADLKKTFVNNKVTKDSIFQIKYEDYIQFITDKRSKIDKIFKQKSELLVNLDNNEKKLKSKIAELKDRKILSNKKEEVKKAISNHKVLSVLNNHSSAFNTNSISRKTSLAREELVSQDFNQIFSEELKAFRKSNLPIELSFGTDRGRSRLSHRIGNKQLLEILSEGEQKTIALSEFLTELQLDNIKAPVIFDDPVNSLDHKIIDEVSKRLIKLSKERQVVIFTHSILLLNSLIQQSELSTNKQLGINFNFFKVKSNFGETGIIDEVEEVNSYSYYAKKLHKVLEVKPNGKDEAQLAAEGYGHLRSAIEVSVENEVLQKTIKRYSKGVAFPSLLRVKGDKIDENKGELNDIYEKCCTSIDGHSNPEEVLSTPTMDELKSDYESFKKIRGKFK